MNNNSESNSSAENKGISFSDFLNNALTDVNKLQVDSEELNEAFAMGKIDNLHQVSIAAEKADIAFQLTVQIREKVLTAYQEIMRMPV
jgi:flagellar hook-basal body complex protein FliE